MYGIDFDSKEEDNDFATRSRHILGEKDSSAIVRFMKRIGLAKNKAQANVILLIIFVIAISATYLLIRPSEEPMIVTPDGRRINVEDYLAGLERGVDLIEEGIIDNGI